jgi:predicted  nucleic acid-binding Zn ribbon protein
MEKEVEKIKVCSKCYEAVVRLFSGGSASTLEAECPKCKRKFQLEEEKDVT